MTPKWNNAIISFGCHLVLKSLVYNYSYQFIPFINPTNKKIVFHSDFGRSRRGGHKTAPSPYDLGCIWEGTARRVIRSRNT